ncbi:MULTISPECIES: glycosyltransferase family 4 protein [unclassified Inquilinus]|uniref:glycosyltransferase family 4 protein n=1 Tax=unclassified Inquilinus TaxID=2645927 RepID=UPI003F9286F1
MTTILAHARKHATVTGIQRVVLRVVGHLVATHGPAAIRGIAWHPKLRRVVEIDLSFLGPDYRFEAHRDAFLRDMAVPDDAEGRKQGLRRRIGTRIDRLRWRALGDGGSGPHLAEPSLRPEDRILLLAPNFRNEPYIAYLAGRKKAGTAIFQMIHDVIPLLKPWLSKPGHDVEFRRFLERTPGYVSGFLCVSDQTEADLRMVMPAAGGEIPTRVVPLAHEFMGDVGDDGVPIGHAVRALAEHPFVLCVGTIEVRKNTLALCKVWAQLRQDLGVGLPRLVLAGQRGWQTEDVFDLLRATGNLGGYAALAEAPSDAELAFLYRNCRFTVFPSLYEGWGLPIGESLWFGKHCIASKTSSMPQVGGDLAEYVDPYDLEDMRRVIGRAIAEPDHVRGREDHIRAASLRRWGDVAGGIVALASGASKGRG